jgi:hypothetical protein
MALKPELGQWYIDRDQGNIRFEVVAIDEDDVVEIQYEDGAVEELDIEDWYDMDYVSRLEKCSTPIEFDEEDEDGEFVDEFGTGR